MGGGVLVKVGGLDGGGGAGAVQRASADFGDALGDRDDRNGY